MIEDVFRTEDLPRADRFDAWCERAAQSHAPVEMSSAHVADFRGFQQAVQLGAVPVYASEWQPAVVRRTPRLVRRSDPERYRLSFVRSGTVGTAVNGQHITHGPCGLFSHTTSAPLELRIGTREDRVKAVSVEVPRTLMPQPAAQVDHVIGRPLSGRDGTSALLAAFLTTLTAGARSCTTADAARLETVLLDLVTAVFAHELDAVDHLPPEAHRRTLTLGIRAFIRQHLHDPALTPAVIAAAHHISVSHLHRLFQPERDTVAAYIRHQRLERIRRDLSDPAQRTIPVHRIAARWGLTQHTAFTRAFRARYGISPRDYRVQTLGSGTTSAGQAAASGGAPGQ
ncbi:helix-turn-helix domain-containing protein [Streptomyces sp. 5-6(2022)]|uniref:helix-turn-helix domain-containing protein n=1 Tax=Streptomyces sp. 5-6(2022) TaxID=2936510 RepID=UPI0023B8A5F8|nr:helix-turn-helix domain-containing protein [Streptomyces sp. 5-6(2022)]